jgi:quercetin dioxygenase-like cupin family protein
MRIRRLADPAAGHGAVQARGVGRLGGSELKVVTVAAGASVQPHRHAHAHLVLVLEGSGFVDAKEGDRRRIDPDTVVVVRPDEEHAFGAAPAEPLRFVCLDGFSR